MTKHLFPFLVLTLAATVAAPIAMDLIGTMTLNMAQQTASALGEIN